MRPVRKTEHNAYQIHYHFVTPVKYRKAIFGLPDREQSLQSICKEIEERYSIEFKQVLRKELWGGELWTDGFFVATVGEGGNRDVIRVYIENQGKVSHDLQLKLFDFNL